MCFNRKIFFIARFKGGGTSISRETDGVDFLALDSICPVVERPFHRATIARMFVHERDRQLQADFD